MQPTLVCKREGGLLCRRGVGGAIPNRDGVVDTGQVISRAGCHQASLDVVNADARRGLWERLGGRARPAGHSHRSIPWAACRRQAD